MATLPRLDTIELYKSGLRRQWRWRYLHSNGRILADSGESYARRIDCVKGAATVTGAEISTLEPFGTARRGETRIAVRFGK